MEDHRVELSQLMEAIMTKVSDRVFQPSDLAGTGRAVFIEYAKEDRARLRTKDGEQLIMLRETALECLANLRSHALSYFMLDSALTRPHEDRRASDFGEWAFIHVFDDEDQKEFRTDMNEALILATSNNDLAVVLKTLEEWRRSARTLSDPVAREILSGNTSALDWNEVERPATES